ncbi:MAG: divalent-cation tolerance protein CutA [Kangiellaceae bacterium]|jgi:periplasmic divalent cation tolerance protein|nr:divalent-cation tolerance protein CutA [Kangiellaceae bacterium]
MKQKDDIVVLLTTVGNLDEAKALSSDLVTKKMAGCVNLLPPMQSYYWWHNSVECSDEFQLVIKTTQQHVNAIEQYFKVNHSYQLPEFIVMTVDKASDEYKNWLVESLL